jgi:hypothetical protein
MIRVVRWLLVIKGALICAVGCQTMTPPGATNPLRPDPRDSCFKGIMRRAASPALRSRSNAQDPGAGAAPGPDVVKVVQSHAAEVRTCFQGPFPKGLVDGGTFTVTFVVSPSGAVAASMVGPSTLNNPDIESCVGRLVCRWTFPKPAGESGMMIDYPIIVSLQQ